jgi:Coenzyme PQQ synthesis protein D (PqqD)
MERIRRNRDVAHRLVEGQAVIVLPRSGEIMVLNETGAVVWDLSDGEHDIEDIVDELTKRFDVSPAAAQEDVESLYRELIEAGVAQPVS